MKLAIMQPYFFPYIGYYQLVNSVDEFVFFDDVNFIKKGYIHRNTICSQQAPLNFTLPVKNISQNRKINEHFYVKNFEKFKNSIYLSYKKTPFFAEIFNLIENILSTDNLNVAELNSKTITSVFEYLDIQKKFSFASTLSIPKEEKGQNRIISICKKKSCSTYHNPIGAKDLDLYDSLYFSKNNIELRFIRKNIIHTHLQNNNFSMIDILTNNHPDEIKACLSEYKLVS